MRYYIRRDPLAEIEGPYNVEELTAQLDVGDLPLDSLASSDIGDRIDRLAWYRSCDWFALSRIPGLNHLPVFPGPKIKVKQPVSLICLAFWCAGVLLSVYLVAVTVDWLPFGLWAAWFLWRAVNLFKEYAIQRPEEDIKQPITMAHLAFLGVGIGLFVHLLVTCHGLAVLVGMFLLLVPSTVVTHILAFVLRGREDP